VTPRQRYMETVLFGAPDRVPFAPGGPRESTLKAWRTQGLREGESWWPQLLEAVGVTPDEHPEAVGVGVSFRLMPEFEEQILEHRDGHYILQDYMGAVVEISDCFDASYIRSAKDFVTRKWHRFPVTCRKDFEERMRFRYDPDTAARYPEGDPATLARLPGPDRPSLIAVGFNGPFWQLREWCGFENLCELFLDDPEFVRDMVSFWADFVDRILERIIEHTEIDRIHFSEDMAYKAHAMISPAMTREFLVPAYERWIATAKRGGCRVFDVDSDGWVGDLIPVWIDAGINLCDPMEVAAGNDLAAFREQFGTRMAYAGGIDKRAIAAGGETMRAELKRVIPPLFKQGGFIPSCDHGVPPDISWPAFVDYSRELAAYCGWR
jgi:hypothetical protein